MTEHPYIAVLPDGVAVVITRADSDSTEREEEEVIVKMKTCLSEEAIILRTAEIVEWHGTHVQCKYGYEIFSDCNSSDNNFQVGPPVQNNHTTSHKSKKSVTPDTILCHKKTDDGQDECINSMISATSLSHQSHLSFQFNSKTAAPCTIQGEELALFHTKSRMRHRRFIVKFLSD